MKRLLALVVLLLAGGIAVGAADRIYTNPKPEGHFKALFPNAVAFSTFGGTPLHWTAYAADPAKTPNPPVLGYIFWTTDLVPQEHGYHGAIHLLVGLNPNGTISGVVMDYNSEPYGYFSVDPAEFAAQFKGKSIFDKFQPGADVDFVSRASLSVASASRAIRDSSRMVARALLDPAAVKR